ncbi:hypothetical protein [Methylorubrum extorquens]|uniref:hypothetical protein n=1 Tax=Methylorubrum extorquens TaxID=408 RepID=UPI001AEE9C80|nr:hypothetical protein [Methylorubrum extorquens]
MVALWVNGRRGRETSLIRTLGRLGGFVFWLAIALGFVLTAPPITTGVAVYTILLISIQKGPTCFVLDQTLSTPINVRNAL